MCKINIIAADCQLLTADFFSTFAETLQLMLVIGIAGGSGSGKTTVVNKIIQGLPPRSVSIISQDAYYWDNGHLSPEEKKLINFDHPDSIEWELLIRHLDLLMKGHPIEMPGY
jgi:uridine kinase